MTAQQAVSTVTDTIKKVTEPIKAQVAKPDHPFWRKLGNFFVMFVAPVGTIAIETFVPDKYRQIAQISLNSLAAIIKTGSKFTVKK